MATDYEAWRPALIAFYRADCWFQSADNLEKLRMPLTLDDKRQIDALKAAAERMPRAA
jgi:hypothetical protein